MNRIVIKSKVRLKEKIENKDRLFGSNTHYYPAYIKTLSGAEVPAFFTASQLKIAMQRSVKNKEDLIELEPFMEELQ